MLLYSIFVNDENKGDTHYPYEFMEDLEMDGFLIKDWSCDNGVLSIFGERE